MASATATFDVEAARRVLSRKWADAIFRIGFAPLEALISGLEPEFARVPSDKRPNKVALFRFRNKNNEVAYNIEAREFRACSNALKESFGLVLEYVAEAHAEAHPDVESRFAALLERWRALAPNNLVGRTDDGILAYVEVYRRLAEQCLMDMFSCEERMHESLIKRRRLAGQTARSRTVTIDD